MIIPENWSKMSDEEKLDYIEKHQYDDGRII